MAAFDDLMRYQRETVALEQVAGRLGWDQETMMPKGAGEQRAEEIAAISTVLHQRRSAAQVGDWLAQIDDSDLPPEARAQVRLIRRD
ncbi:MAG: carboxypeptidase M32, partial [Lutimaribacter sp.]